MIMALFATYWGSGTQAVKVTLPLLGDNTYKLHVGPNVLAKAFWSVPRDVVVWENLMNAKTLLLTANTETVYACVI